MVLLQPRLNLKVTQKQILTPGLVQMVSVLALNKIELKDMITAEMVENPVLEELDGTVPMLDDIAGREEQRERADRVEETAPDPVAASDTDKSDSFEEIDFGSFFQEYLDPGYRTNADFESVERPSFENFLSKPSTLTDHLMWQLGSNRTTPGVRAAAELVIGNLDEEGYLTASDEELFQQSFFAMGIKPVAVAPPVHNNGNGNKNGNGNGAGNLPNSALMVGDGELAELASAALGFELENSSLSSFLTSDSSVAVAEEIQVMRAVETLPIAQPEASSAFQIPEGVTPLFTREELTTAIDLLQQFDPIGVAARTLRECLLAQLRYHQKIKAEHMVDENGNENDLGETLNDAIEIVDKHLHAIQNKQIKEVSKAMSRSPESIQRALEYIRTLDPKPGRRYNMVEPRLIEPDVAFIKQGDEFLAILNDEDVPQLRLNNSYKRLMNRDAAEKDVRSYVKERYKSAMQLIKNIEQRKQTIMKVCYAILGRQREFLDHGIDYLKPMMIKEVAEEIGVHPSTVSRAVANKYAHTPQGVFELRYFFSESVQGPEGGNTSLLILKRRVKKLIDEEDPARPLTDEQITRILQSQGIQVTRRTVAKYREDMKIPSTHQRRVKS